MDPKEYTGREWTELARRLTARQVRNGVKRAYRRVGNEARRVAVAKLRTSGLNVRGNRADWERGIRSRVYSRGGGFMVTVRAKGANKSGKGERGMHLNRFGVKKPVLKWAEEGTRVRRTKTRTRFFVRQRRGHSTGAMPAYHFLEDATPEMYRVAEQALMPEVRRAVEQAARKAGFM